MIWLGILREILLYFATFGTAFALQGAPVAVMACLLLWGTSALCIYTMDKNGILRYGALLPGLLLFLPWFSKTGILFVVFPLLWLAFRCYKKAWEFSYGDTIRETRIGIFLYGVFALLTFLGGDSSVYMLSVPWFAAFLALSVFLIRVQRNPKQDLKDRTYLLLNILLSAAVGLVFLLICLPAFQQLVIVILTKFYQWLILPVLQGMLASVMLALYALATLLSGFHIEFAQNFVQEMQESYELSNLNEEFTFTDAASYAWILTALKILLFLAVVYLIWRVIRKGRQDSTRRQSSLGFTREHIRRRKDILASVSSSGVRKAYAQYLLLCGKHGIPVQGELASDAVAKISDSMIGTDESEQLRQLWLPVRYGNAKEKQDKKADELYKSIRRKMNEL